MAFVILYFSTLVDSFEIIKLEVDSVFSASSKSPGGEAIVSDTAEPVKIVDDPLIIDPDAPVAELQHAAPVSYQQTGYA